MRLAPKALGIHTVGVAAFAAAGVLSFCAANWAANAVEDVSATAVRRALDEGGNGWAKVSADGLQVTISGEAPTEAMRFRALGAAATVIDAGRVVDAMTVPDPSAVQAPDFSVEILRNDDGISLIGLVPAASGRDDIVTSVTSDAKGAPVTDMLEAANDDAPKGWSDALAYGLDALGDLPRAKISIAPAHVAITAITDSAEQKSRLEAQLRAAAPKGMALDLDISAPRPVITPFTLRFLIDGNGPHFDACSADSDKAQAQILAAAKDAGTPGTPDCTVGLGTPSPAWGEAAVKSIAALAKLGAGSVTISDADVSLIAADTVARADFERVAGDLDAALPSVFSLTARLTPKPEAQTEASPEVSAVLDAKGKVELRGGMPDESTRNVVTNFARARFGSEDVHMATRLDQGLPAGWAVRVLAGLEALSRVHDGSVLVSPDIVRITGNTGNRDTGSQIARMLSEKLGEGQEFDIRVSYDRRLDPSLALPSADQCIERVQAVLAKGKVNFEPGSANVTADSVPILDQLATALKDCGDFPMEIAGYTDSQGRDEMNQALSENRAQAVLAQLMQRQVLTGNLDAVGYGEADPIADNGTEAGREANRRIEFHLRDDAAAPAAPAPAAPAEAPAPSADARPAPRPAGAAEAAADQSAADDAQPSDADLAADDAAASEPGDGSGDDLQGSGDESYYDESAGYGDMGPDGQGSGDEGSGDEGSGDEGSGDAGPDGEGAGDAGPGDAGSGDAGSGDAAPAAAPDAAAVTAPEAAPAQAQTDTPAEAAPAQTATPPLPEATSGPAAAADAQDGGAAVGSAPAIAAATGGTAPADGATTAPATAPVSEAASTPAGTPTPAEGATPAAGVPAAAAPADGAAAPNAAASSEAATTGAAGSAATSELPLAQQPVEPIEVQTPGEGTVKPPARPAAIEGKTAP